MVFNYFSGRKLFCSFQSDIDVMAVKISFDRIDLGYLVSYLCWHKTSFLGFGDWFRDSIYKCICLGCINNVHFFVCYDVAFLLVFIMFSKDFLIKILGFKSMNHGTAHWLQQRLSSIILIPFTFFFVFSFGKQLGMNHGEILEIYSNPFRSLFTIVFLGVTLIHLHQGVQVVIEDYIHSDGRRKFMLFLNTMVFWSLSVTLLYSLGSLVFL